jgi:hypothetical protein
MKKLIEKFLSKKLLTKPEATTPFNPRTRIHSENMTDEEKLKQGFNGSTYSINGRDVDF